MFGFKRSQVTAQVLNNVRLMFRMVEVSLGRLPDGMRSDPYILGYFMSTVAALTAVFSGNSIKGVDAGRVMSDVAQGIFGEGGHLLLKRMLAFHSEGNNSEFNRGVENAQKVVVIAFGMDQLLGDPDVIRACARMVVVGSSLDFATPGASEGSRLAGILQNQLFDDYVKQTFGSR